MIGSIYRIIHTESDLCYIGSTSGELRFRWQVHRNAYKRWDSGKRGDYVSIYPHFKKHGIDKFRMLLIKVYEVENRKHLQAYEQLWINKFRKTAVNKNNPLNIKPVTKKRDLDIMKAYHLKNKDKIKERKGQKFNCECGGKYSLANKAKHSKTNRHQDWVANQ